jgi:MYXO-CTERM domain-containing protein
MGMTSPRIALFAAVSAVVLWAVKAIAIGVAGGLDRSPLEAPLFFAGLLCFVTAAVTLGVALTRGRSAWLRVLTGVIVAPAAGVAFPVLVDALVGAFQSAGQDRPWVWTEFNLWAAAIVALALALVVRRREAVRG